MTSFYLASRYSRRSEMRKYRRQLERAGHRVTSRWLTEDSAENSQTASRDLADIETAIFAYGLPSSHAQRPEADGTLRQVTQQAVAKT
jgi:hypothetical protein